MPEYTVETRQNHNQVIRDKRFVRDAFLEPQVAYGRFLFGKYKDRRSYFTGTDPRYAGWDYETGMPMGPVPTGSMALQYQDYAEGLARQRQADRWSDAQRSMELAGQSFSQYRNNAASRLQSGLYQNQASLYAQQAGSITAPDVLGGWREEQRQQSLREARRARRRAETMQWVGLGLTAIGTLVGGVGGAAVGAALGGGANILANRERQRDQAAQEGGEAWRDTAGGAGGGLTLPGGDMPFSGQPGVQQQGGGGGLVLPAGAGPSPQGNVAPPMPGGGPVTQGGGPQTQGGYQQRQQQGGGGGYMPEQQAGGGYARAGGGGQGMRGGGGQGQPAQQGMGMQSPAEAAFPIMLAQATDEDSSIDEFYAGLKARTAMISSGAYLA